MRPATTLCAAVLNTLLACPIAAQIPTVQNPGVRPYTSQTVLTPAQQIAALQQQVAALQTAVAALQNKTQLIASDGQSLTIQAPGTITFAAAQQTNISGNALSLSAGASATLQAAAISVQGSTMVGVKGAMVQINSGGKPAARVGDPVTNGTVIAGSPTVLIGS